eukprot:4156472-Pyramimonas_sp.AAC.2
MSTGSPRKEPTEWTPPSSIEPLYEKASSVGGLFRINRPTSGARSEAEVPVGQASFQLYSLSTPNGQKVGILLEELGIKYDAHVLRIGPNQLHNTTVIRGSYNETMIQYNSK